MILNRNRFIYVTDSFALNQKLMLHCANNCATPRRVIYIKLTCVRPLVGLEMGALRVDFLASDELAFVYPPFRVGRVIEAVVFGGGYGGGRCCRIGRDGRR